ncbi:MAG: HEPN domain-containing protein [Bacteroidetes bacterium]|nr:HEPN domain-containing protein [Bacteroidota bacterium]MBS1540330.1 HEPN domain-containing protein [Bacteroidota bacterium]
MGKNEIIAHWITMAERDWKSVEALLHAGQFMHALFFSHLVIEKLMKANWMHDNIEGQPPRIHDLEYLYNQTELSLTDKQVEFLGVLNAWNLEGRYQDYKDKLYKRANKSYAEEKINQVNELRLCLLSELQKKK